MDEQLLRTIKNRIDITFDDEDIDDKVIGIIEDGIQYLRPLFGMPDGMDFDWNKPSEERAVLINYCLYELNNVSEHFITNYRNDIMRIRARYEVEQWKKADSTTTLTE